MERQEGNGRDRKGEREGEREEGRENMCVYLRSTPSCCHILSIIPIICNVNMS